MSLPNPSMDAIPFTPLTAEFVDNMIENIEALSDGSGVVDGGISRTQLETITRYLNIYGTRLPAPSTGTTVMINAGYFRVPDDYVSGNIVIKASSRNSVGSGVVARILDAYRFRNAAAFSVLANTVSVNRTVSNTNTSEGTVLTILAANFQAGDNIWFSLQRNGNDGADTNTGVEDIDSVWIEYSGKA